MHYAKTKARKLRRHVLRIWSRLTVRFLQKCLCILRPRACLDHSGFLDLKLLGRLLCLEIPLSALHLMHMGDAASPHFGSQTHTMMTDSRLRFEGGARGVGPCLQGGSPTAVSLK
eukprot:6466262-Amphidinium_carterae.1